MQGVAIWDQGDMGPIISGLTAYSLQNYFAIPKLSRSAVTPSRSVAPCFTGCAASP